MRPSDDPAQTLDGALLAADREWRRAERLTRLLENAEATISQLRAECADYRARLIEAYTRD